MKSWCLSVALRWSVFVLLVPATAQSFPAEYVNALQRASYAVYVADINGDSTPDYLIKAKRTIVLIDFEVLIPVPLKPASPTFLLRSQGGSYVLEVNPPATTVNNAAWQPGAAILIYGDVQGVGTNAMLIQSRVANSPSFMISTRDTDGQPVLTQHVTAAQLGLDLGSAEITVTLTDANRDGRADLVVRTSGRITDVFIANGDGLFAKPSDDQQASIAPWYAFSASLSAGDVQSALNFISLDSVPKYSAALTALGAATSGLTQNWSSPLPVLVQSDMAVYLIRENFSGVQRSYLVTIVLENGRWVIDEL